MGQRGRIPVEMEPPLHSAVSTAACSRQLLDPLLFAQVVDIPEALLEDHDLTVDYILTPTRVITTGCERPKPTGITWSKVGQHVASRAATASRGRRWPQLEGISLSLGPPSGVAAVPRPAVAYVRVTGSFSTTQLLITVSRHGPKNYSANPWDSD